MVSVWPPGRETDLGTWTSRQPGLSLFSRPLSVCQLGRSVPRLAEASIWDQRWREQMQAGRKQEAAPHLGYYRSGRTFLIAEDVKEREGEKSGERGEGGGNISKLLPV